jgi:16S rRNA (uracil1498-N3)-methyltransferase
MARTPRLTWRPEGPADGTGDVWLDPDQARHGVTVLRLKPGDLVELAGPAGLLSARVTTAEGGRGRPARLGVAPLGGTPLRASMVPDKAPMGPGPRLALALISLPRFDWAVEKAAELEAGEIWPLICDRVKPGLALAGAGRTERWRRLAEEARKQCGRPRPLVIHPPLTTTEFMYAIDDRPVGFFLSPAGAPVESFQKPLGPLWVLAGPEAGFSPREEAAFLAAGLRPWRLGPLTLRTETAALAALAKLL